MSRYIYGKSKVQKRLAPLLAVIFVLSILLPVTLPTTKSDALSGSQFNAGRIIDDAVFYNKNTMSAAQIQSFLNSKVPVCDTNHPKSSSSNDSGPPYTCLKDYRQNTTNIAPESGLCNGYTGASNETAAQIIYKVAQSCGINPKVILVMLQKEQSLITDTWPWDIQYKKAMGAFCPDTAPCDPTYAGFFYQVYYGAHRFKVYRANPDNFNYKAERNNSILWHPNSSCGRSTVYIQNQATAALYIYTPYRPNKAALDNLYGTGDSCSSYGNRNFWRLFNDWFGPTTGTPLFRFGYDSTVYILGANNNYYRFPSNKMLKIYGYGDTISSIKTVSTSYVSGKTFSGNIPVIARFDGDEIYTISKGRSHHYTSRTLLQTFGYDIGQEALLQSSAKEYFPTSDDMQTVIKNSDGNEVWYVQNGKKRHIINGEAYLSGDPSYASMPSVSIGFHTAADIANGAPIATANKLFKRSDKNSFVFWNGTHRQDVSNVVVSDLKKNIDYSTRAYMIDQLPSVGPRISKYAKDDSDILYILDNRQKYLVSSSDLAEMNLTSSSFVLTPNEFLSDITTTKPFRRIFRINNSSAIYLIEGGKRHHLNDPAAVAEKGFTIPQAINLNTSSANLFPDSGKKILSIGTLFRIGSSDKVYVVNSPTSSLHVTSSALMRDYGFSFSRVNQLSGTQASGYPEIGKLGYFSKDSSDNVWHIQYGNERHAVPVELRDSTRYNLNITALPLLDSSILDRYSITHNLTDLVQSPGNDRVYSVENGSKRWITSRAAFDSNGFSFSNLTYVSADFLASIPTGSDIN